MEAKGGKVGTRKGFKPREVGWEKSGSGTQPTVLGRLGKGKHGNNLRIISHPLFFF